MFRTKPATLQNLTMPDNRIDPTFPTADSNDEYPQVTQADLDRATFRVGLQPAPDKDEIERIRLVNSEKLKSILDDAEARIRATGGVQHDDFWSQLDAEYQDVDAESQVASSGDQKKTRKRRRSELQPALSPTPVVAVAEPKADYQVDAD